MVENEARSQLAYAWGVYDKADKECLVIGETGEKSAKTEINGFFSSIAEDGSRDIQDTLQLYIDTQKLMNPVVWYLDFEGNQQRASNIANGGIGMGKLGLDVALVSSPVAHYLSPETTKQSWQNLKEVGYQLAEPAIKDWNEGNYGKAIGHGSYIPFVFLGSKGIGKLSRGFDINQMVPDDVDVPGGSGGNSGSGKDWPGATPKSDAVVDDLGHAMEEAKVGINKPTMLGAAEHADGTVTIGLSGSEKKTKKFITRITPHLPSETADGKAIRLAPDTVDTSHYKGAIKKTKLGDIKKLGIENDCVEAKIMKP
jgi:hypothetical protein